MGLLRSCFNGTDQNEAMVITDARRQAFEWFRTEMADVWLGFTRREIEAWLEAAGPSNLRYELVGPQ